MQAVDSLPHHNSSTTNPSYAEARSSGIQPSKGRYSLSLISSGGGIMKKLSLGTSRGSRETRDIMPSRPRPTSIQSISSLAAATLLGLAQTQRMTPLSEAAGSSLKSILTLTKNGLLGTAVPSRQEHRSSEQSDLLDPPLENLDHIMNHHDHSDLSAPMLMSMQPNSSRLEQEDHVSIGPLHSIVPTASLGVDPSFLGLDPVIPNTSGQPLNETKTEAHPMPIPQHMRPFMRPAAQGIPVLNPILHNNRRFQASPFNRSSSSVVSATTYATAPTGISPPHSIQSILRCESPGPLLDTHRRSRVISFQNSSLRESVIADGLHGALWASGKSRSSTYNTASFSDSPSRRILIIGSSYKDHGEVKRMFSIETLEGALEDREQLKSVFKERSYSVQTLFEEGFNRERALARVAQFLDDAEGGDVRAIVFTGHGIANEDGTVSLVPPECPQSSGTIARSEWDQNIRDHSRPGVVVFSIMAHCYSGRGMEEFNRQAWEAPVPHSGIREDAPIYLTFAASNETAYESWVTRGSDSQSARTCDHFIHALVGAIRTINVSTGTWSEFFQAFDRHFHRARSCASWQDKRGPSSTPNWRLNNQQSPRFSASGFVRISVVF